MRAGNFIGQGCVSPPYSNRDVIHDAACPSSSGHRRVRASRGKIRRSRWQMQMKGACSRRNISQHRRLATNRTHTVKTALANSGFSKPIIAINRNKQHCVLSIIDSPPSYTPEYCRLESWYRRRPLPTSDGGSALHKVTLRATGVCDVRSHGGGC